MGVSRDYVIRITRSGEDALVQVTPQVSEHAAICRARVLAKDGDMVEIWRGMNRVFSQASDYSRMS